MTWLIALAIWTVASIPFGIALGKFIKRGRGPEGEE